MIGLVQSAIYLVEEDRLIDIQDTLEHPPETWDLILDIYSSHHAWDGIIAIHANKGFVFEVVDELTPLIMNLCFAAVGSLAEGIPFTYQYTASPAAIYLSFDSEDQVTFAPDFDEAFMIPRKELLIGLFHCGEQYMDLLQRLNEVRPELHLTNHIPYLQPLADEARAALVASGYLDG